jgi:hypothetical protein
MFVVAALAGPPNLTPAEHNTLAGECLDAEADACLALAAHHASLDAAGDPNRQRPPRDYGRAACRSGDAAACAVFVNDTEACALDRAFCTRPRHPREGDCFDCTPPDGRIRRTRGGGTALVPIASGGWAPISYGRIGPVDRALVAGTGWTTSGFADAVLLHPMGRAESGVVFDKDGPRVIRLAPEGSAAQPVHHVTPTHALVRARPLEHSRDSILGTVDLRDGAFVPVEGDFAIRNGDWAFTIDGEQGTLRGPSGESSLPVPFEAGSRTVAALDPRGHLALRTPEHIAVAGPDGWIPLPCLSSELAWGPEGTLFVVLSDRVLRFDEEGRLLASWAIEGALKRRHHPGKQHTAVHPDARSVAVGATLLHLDDPSEPELPAWLAEGETVHVDAVTPEVVHEEAVTIEGPVPGAWFGVVFDGMGRRKGRSGFGRAVIAPAPPDGTELLWDDPNGEWTATWQSGEEVVWTRHPFVTMRLVDPGGFGVAGQGKVVATVAGRRVGVAPRLDGRFEARADIVLTLDDVPLARRGDDHLLPGAPVDAAPIEPVDRLQLDGWWSDPEGRRWRLTPAYFQTPVVAGYVKGVSHWTVTGPDAIRRLDVSLERVPAPKSIRNNRRWLTPRVDWEPGDHASVAMSDGELELTMELLVEAWSDGFDVVETLEAGGGSFERTLRYTDDGVLEAVLVNGKRASASTLNRLLSQWLDVVGLLAGRQLRRGERIEETVLLPGLSPGRRGKLDVQTRTIALTYLGRKRCALGRCARVSIETSQDLPPLGSVHRTEVLLHGPTLRPVEVRMEGDTTLELAGSTSRVPFVRVHRWDWTLADR